jgi:hypothetical protein
MHQRSKLVSPSTIIGATVLIGLLVFGVTMFREMRDAAHRSCLASVKAAVQVCVATNGITFRNVPAGGARLLSQPEVAEILNRLPGLDCARFRNNREMPVDAWGRPFCVTVANTQWGLHATVFSAGRDGQPGTADDVH